MIAASGPEFEMRVLVLGDVRGRGRGSGLEVEDRRGWIVEFSDGRAAGLHGFLDQRQALEAAGLRQPADEG